MKRAWVLATCALFLLLCSSPVFASGFAINEHGTKAVGMGGAFVAQADDPSAVYFNPAGIIQLNGTQVMAGFAIIMPNAAFESNGTSIFGTTGRKTDVEDQTFFIPNFFLTHKINDKWSFGMGGFSNFGLTTEWPGTWEGRYITGATKAEVVTLTLNPVVAFRPIKRLSISFGLLYQYLDVELNNKVFTDFTGQGFPDADSTLTGDNWELGWNMGVLFWATDALRFGLSYRPEVSHTVDGTVSVTGTPGGAADFSVDAKADLNLPQVLYLGMAYTWNAWTFEVDGQWTDWSSYDKLEARTEGGGILASSSKNWNDVWAYRFGVNYKINEEFDVRGGMVFDEAPMPSDTFDPLLPSGDRILYTLGGSWRRGNFKLDLAYNYLQDDGGTFNNDVGNYDVDFATQAGLPTPFPPGTFGNVTGEFNDVSAHIVMLNASYRF